MSFVVAHMQKLGDKVHMKPEAWHRVGLKSPNEPDKQPKKRPEKNQGIRRQALRSSWLSWSVWLKATVLKKAVQRFLLICLFGVLKAPIFGVFFLS